MIRKIIVAATLAAAFGGMAAPVPDRMDRAPNNPNRN
jgi:hypothetical protein